VIYLITVNYYSTELIANLLRSIQLEQPASYKLIIVNNSPDDALLPTLEMPSTFIIEAQENLGYGRACNIALNWVYAHDPQAIVWLINPDAHLVGQSIEQAQAFFHQHPEVSISGTAVYDSAGKVWFGGGIFLPLLGAILSKNLLSKYSKKDYFVSEWVTGCSLLINLKHFSECPFFDPDYFLYYEDFDFCQRYAHQNHLVAVNPKITVIHQVSSTTQRNISAKIRHSTYSYLITLEKHASSPVLLIRLLGIIGHSIIRLPIKPKVSIGAFRGIWFYLKRAIQP
jgi:GT2 family glycosyltransferase